jgi:bifunctional oligoribonuclease and PAP phosphatase NrnA
MNHPFEAIAEAIQAATSIVVLSHVRPDGDAIGSQIALAVSLEHLGKQVWAWNEDGLPTNFRFLQRSELIEQPPAEPRDVDLAIALDTASQQRLGTALSAIRSAKCWINIDHHIGNPRYGDLVYVDADAPATGQIVYEFLRDQQLPLTYPAADALYVAISTDTGSFRYPSTNARTFEIAAELITAGVDAGTISRRLYESYPKRRVLLLGELLHTARFCAGGRLASFSLPASLKARFGVLPEDIDGLIDYIRAIDEVIVAAFFEEMGDGRVRISLRSKDPRVDVNLICATYGGGGHRLAAGARIRGPLAEVEEKVISRVSDEIASSI